MLIKYVDQQNTQKKYTKNRMKHTYEKEKQILINRRKLDKPATLLNTIQWYDKIGYKNVDIYYKYYRYFVIAGEKWKLMIIIEVLLVLI